MVAPDKDCKKCEYHCPDVIEGNEDIVRLYQYMGGGCWRVAGMGGVIGLDWPSVKIIADALDIPIDTEILTGLKVIESESLKYLNKKENMPNP